MRHIERREYKYLIHEATAARVRAWIAPFCDLDPHAARQPSGRYRIQSLYLDTPHMGLFRANEREQRDRFKLRVRTYPDVSSSAAFFEVKRRYHDVIVKDRGVAPARWPELLETAGVVPTADERERSGPALEAFVSLVHSYAARPVVLVDYEREPWASTVDDYARVTLDRDIRCQRTSACRFAEPGSPWRCVDHAHRFTGGPESLTVLELKFTSAVPSWMVHLVQSLELERRAFSKYGLSIEAWADRPTLRLAAGAGGLP